MHLWCMANNDNTVHIAEQGTSTVQLHVIWELTENTNLYNMYSDESPNKATYN